MLGKWWEELERKFPSLKIDEYYVVMPNHFHGIVWVSAEEPRLSQIQTLSLGIPRCLWLRADTQVRPYKE